MTVSFVDSTAVTRNGWPDFAGEVPDIFLSVCFRVETNCSISRLSGEAEMRRRKGKAIPVQAWTCPEDIRFQGTRFKYSRHSKAVRSALRTGRLYPLGSVPSTHFYERLSRV